MGIDRTAFRLLSMLSRQNEINFSRTAMIGRQKFDVRPKKVPQSAIPAGFTWKAGTFAEDLFRAFGATDIQSFDVSPYEEATIIHDFNKPVPTEQHGRYTLVYDGGSIEHIIDPRQAVENEASILAEGGHLVVLTQCNGAPSHGFYQLSPEFFYSLLHPRNGFSSRVFLIDRDADKWHFVQPPTDLFARNTIPNRRFDIACVAKKIETVQTITAQQSDYEAVWHGIAFDQSPKTTRSWRYMFYQKGYREFVDQSPVFNPETIALGP